MKCICVRLCWYITILFSNHSGSWLKGYFYFVVSVIVDCVFFMHQLVNQYVEINSDSTNDQRWTNFFICIHHPPSPRKHIFYILSEKNIFNVAYVTDFGSWCFLKCKTQSYECVKRVNKMCWDLKLHLLWNHLTSLFGKLRSWIIPKALNLKYFLNETISASPKWQGCAALEFLTWQQLQYPKRTLLRSGKKTF